MIDTDQLAVVKADLYKSNEVFAPCVNVTDATSNVNVTFSCPKKPFDFIRIVYPSERRTIRQIDVFTSKT